MYDGGRVAAGTSQAGFRVVVYLDSYGWNDGGTNKYADAATNYRTWFLGTRYAALRLRLCCGGTKCRRCVKKCPKQTEATQLRR